MPINVIMSCPAEMQTKTQIQLLADASAFGSCLSNWVHESGRAILAPTRLNIDRLRLSFGTELIFDSALR